jgi:hypothetical protein
MQTTRATLGMLFPGGLDGNVLALDVRIAMRMSRQKGELK